MDKLCRGIPSYYAMLRIWWNRRFFDMSYSLGIMVSWKSLAKGIKGHWHRLVPGPQIEPEQHDSVPWAWASVFRHGKCDKVIWSFPQLRFLIMTLACKICIRSHWAKKLVSGPIQWDDLFTMDKLRRGINSCYDMLWVWWNWQFFYLSYRLDIMVSSSRLQKAFTDIGTIWSRGLKMNWSSIIAFCELEQVQLGMENEIRSSEHSRGWYFWNWTPHAKFALGLTKQKN